MTKTLFATAIALSAAACGGGGAAPDPDPTSLEAFTPIDVGEPGEAGNPDEASNLAPDGTLDDDAANGAEVDSLEAGGDPEATEALSATDASEDATARQPCVAPEGTTGSPATVPELIALLNALPRPTSIACFLESLDRPLEIYLTRSNFSAQPASGERNPRTFINIGRLSVSIVPGGRASHLLEFGYRATDARSVKGEVPFPLFDDVTAEGLVDRIEAGRGSICGGCHTRESPALGTYFPGAFESNVIVPSAYYEVELSFLRDEAESCDRSLEPGRCDILDGLFDHGEVKRSPLWPEE